MAFDGDDPLFSSFNSSGASRTGSSYLHSSLTRWVWLPFSSCCWISPGKRRIRSMCMCRVVLGQQQHTAWEKRPSIMKSHPLAFSSVSSLALTLSRSLFLQHFPLKCYTFRGCLFYISTFETAHAPQRQLKDNFHCQHSCWDVGLGVDQCQEWKKAIST